MEMLLGPQEADVFPQDRDYLRGLSDCAGEVAPRRLDALELQEWCFLLGDPPRYRRDSEIGMVHASPNPPCGSEQDFQ